MNEIGKKLPVTDVSLPNAGPIDGVQENSNRPAADPVQLAEQPMAAREQGVIPPTAGDKKVGDGGTVRHLTGLRTTAIMEPSHERGAVGEAFADAVVFAQKLHAGQTRRGKDTPYISHLIGVASIVLQEGGSEAEAIGGLLHDAIEDAGGMGQLEVIRSRYGDEVAHIVEGCTEPVGPPRPAWQVRKDAYIEHLHEADDSVRLVGAADKIHNVEALIEDFKEQGDDLFDKFNGKKAGTMWFYRACADAVLQHGPAGIAKRLDGAVSRFEALVLAASSSK